MNSEPLAGPLGALAQVGSWLFATILVVGGLELFLYWLLKRFRSVWFWPGNVLLAVALGLLGARVFGGAPVEGGDVGVLATLNLTAGAVGAILVLASAAFARFAVRGKHAIPIMMTAPAFLTVCLLVIYPFFFEFRLAFANLNLYSIGHWVAGGSLGWVGFTNFVNVFTTSPLQTATFWRLFGRTLVWTAVNLVCHVGFGLGLALVLNRKLKGKGLYRTLLILPWAIPQVVSVLAWRGEFHPQFGVVNQMLRVFGMGDINWWSDPIAVFASCCIVNVWLGIPFMMIVFLGGLQSIPQSYYEAASIDGASRWQQFTNITLPMLKPVVVPSITLGTIWTFNNVNVIYLMTGQDGGNEHADILVSALYKSAFTYSRYSFSAAFAMVLFAILLAITAVWMKISRGTESATA